MDWGNKTYKDEYAQEFKTEVAFVFSCVYLGPKNSQNNIYSSIHCFVIWGLLI